MHQKDADKVANSENPDPEEQSFQDLHCLLRLICTNIYLRNKKFCMVQFCVAILETLHSTHGKKNLITETQNQSKHCLIRLLSNTLKFFVEKMREAFALQKLITFFQQKILPFF